jgi:hypothetical protein
MSERAAPRRNREIEIGIADSLADTQSSWRLPFGLELAEFALQGGFLMPALMEAGDSRERESSSLQAPHVTVAGGRG